MKKLIASITAIIAASSASAADLNPKIDSWRQANEHKIVEQLASFVSIRSIEADPAGLNQMADRLQAELVQRGFQARLLRPRADAPATVFAALNTPGARRTVVFYAHYDGQPVKAAQWRTDPFAPAMRSGDKDVAWQAASPPYDPEWRLFGRAASDDKSSIVAFLSAFDALKAAGRKPSVNLRVFWEGEEEHGSPHLAETLRDNKDLLRADLWLIGDAPIHQSRTPTIYFGARGNVDVEATVYGAVRPLHSGHYGNWAPNPAALAALLITQLRDPTGQILIPGFADDVRPLTTAEEQAVQNLPPIDTALKQELGISASESEDMLTASTMRPAMNVVAIQAGDGARAIPSEARITIDFRLVPGQTVGRVAELVEKQLTALGWIVTHQDPDAAERARSSKIVKLVWGNGYPAFRSDMTSAPARAVLAAAQRSSEKQIAVLPMMGGSVPIYVFDEELKTPIVGLPIVNHDNNQHAANENARLQNLWDGIDLYAAMMSELNW